MSSVSPSRAEGGAEGGAVSYLEIRELDGAPRDSVICRFRLNSEPV